MKRKISLSLNKWSLFSAVGVVSALSYGLYAMLSTSAAKDQNFPLPLTIVPETTGQSEDEETQTQQKSESANTSSISVPERLTSSEAVTVSQNTVKTYTVDENGFKSIGKHSMAYKYKDYLILSQASDSIWTEKAKLLKDMVNESPYKNLYSYGYGYGNEKDITAEKVHKFCEWALSYSEGTTFGSIGTSRNYFDLLWKTCGQNGKEKPAGGWYR